MGMKKIKPSKLKKADIILTRNKMSPNSWIVRAGTWSSFSHAILYVGGHSFIDSDSNGVHSNNLQRLLFASVGDMCVLTPKESLSLHQADTICDYARTQVGQIYTKKEALMAALPATERLAGERQFCSRLVAQAYREVGIELTDRPDFCTPDQLRTSELLHQVDDAATEASATEIAFANDVDNNPLLLQERITNNITARVKAATGIVAPTFEDLVSLACRQPANDNVICQIIVVSGYIDMWRWDIEQNPCWYTKEAFEQRFSTKARPSIAAEMLASEVDNLRRFEMSLATLKRAHAHYRRQTTALLITLHEKLINLSRQRTSVYKHFCNRQESCRCS